MLLRRSSNASDDIVAVLDATDTETAAVFAAGSATPLALLAATTKPQRVSALVIYNGYARFTAGPDQSFGMPQHFLHEMKKAVIAAWGSETALRMAGPYGVEVDATMRHQADSHMPSDLALSRSVPRRSAFGGHFYAAAVARSSRASGATQTFRRRAS